MVLNEGKTCLGSMKNSSKTMMKTVAKDTTEVDLDFPEELQKEPSALSLLSKRTYTAKCEKLMSNLHDKKNYVIHIRALMQALDHNLILEKSLQGNLVQSRSMA